MKLTPMQLRKIIKEEISENELDDDVEEQSLLYSVAFDPEVEQAMRALCSVWARKCQERLSPVLSATTRQTQRVVNASREGLFGELRVQLVDVSESVERKCGL